MSYQAVRNADLDGSEGTFTPGAIAMPRDAGSVDHIMATMPRSTLQSRPPRFRVVVPARLRIGTTLIRTRTLDISQAGAKLDLDEVDFNSWKNWPAEFGKLSLINISGLGHLRLGHICWANNGKIGFRFQDLIPIDHIKCILEHNPAS